ncbi:Eukaryotic translation initiation factor 4E-binding protein Mextli [Armadillidium nasatum]|uniref:Eukaryotic translation initiation factor 4E-binding protein Mextli n=1 Tax=Armadillidium nasatum TaxID=96803 RepID=A0A5N5TI05_9CRUS|nr:Eukaryotic translation initiation factor 4E-binding protein Mextli [Armadillidium nasatum]
MNENIGVQGRTNTRRIMKLEKPRPLKMSSSIGDQSIEAVLSEMDLVTQKLNSNIFDQSIFVQITSLCENLKIFGSQLESVYKDQLDRCYVALRNGCRDDNLPLMSRYRLLEVIELRAMNWQPNENHINYYQQKLAQIEAEEMCYEDPNENEITNCANPIGIMTPTTPNSTHIFPGQYPPPTFPTQQVPPLRLAAPQPQQTQPHVVPAAVPILNPGELLKSSGKFSSPVRVPGKNHFKDEIVIRNADSGKVAPGARERLVQITGGSEDNINQAKHLIEETIRRNASPIRSDDASNRPFIASSCSPVSSRASDEMHQECELEDSPTAKLILDEYFGEEKAPQVTSTTSNYNSKTSTNAPSLGGSKSLSIETKGENLSEKNSSLSREDVLEINKNGIVTVLRQPLIPSSSKDVIESVEIGNSVDSNENVKNRRMLFARTNEGRSNVQQSTFSTEDHGVPASNSMSSTSSLSTNRIAYSREFLLSCASSPICRTPPENWQKLPTEVKYVDPSNYLSAELLWSGIRALSLVEEEEGANNANDA